MCRRFSFYITNESGSTTTNLTGSTSGIPISSAGMSGDTTFYTIPSSLLIAEGLDNCLDNGEQLVLTREVFISSCETDTRYGVRWGCDGSENCQEPFEAPGQFNIAQGVPRIRLTNTELIQQNILCEPWIYDYTYTNNGSETQPGAGAAFNLLTLQAFNASGLSLVSTTRWGDPLVQFEYSINGTVIPNCYPCANSESSMGIDPSALTMDFDGPGGLQDLDGDGQFDDLPVGESYTVRLQYTWLCEPDECPVSKSTSAMKTGVEYTNQCKVDIERVVVSTAPSMQQSPLGDPTVIGPADLIDGQQFTVEMCYNYRENFPGIPWSCPTNEMVWQIDAPPGFSLVPGTGELDGDAADASQTGSIVEVIGDLNSGSAQLMCYKVDLVLDCANYMAPPLFDMNLSYTCYVACSCVEQYGCFDWQPNVHCPAPCPEGGLTTELISAERQTLGWEDNFLTTTIDPSTLPQTQLRTDKPCDVFTISLLSEQKSGDNIESSGLPDFEWDNAFVRLEYNQLGGNNLLEHEGGTVDFWDAETMTTIACPLPAPTESVVGGKHILIYDLTSCIADNALEPQDSLNVYADVKILDNSALPQAPVQPTGMIIYHYNEVNGIEYFCDSWALEMYLHRYNLDVRNGFGTVAMNGCNQLTNGIGLWSQNVASDYYPGEFRPMGTLTEYSFTLPFGDVYNPDYVFSFDTRNDDGTVTNTLVGDPVVSFDANGQQVLTWFNDGTWPYADEESDRASYQLNASWLASCQSIDGSISGSGTFLMNDHLTDMDFDYEDSDATSGTVVHNLPNHSIVNTSGTIQATTKDFCWEVEIRNEENIPSENVWVAFESNNSTLDITSVVGASGALTTYGDGQWVQVLDDVAAAEVIPIEVCSELTQCVGDSILMLMGWDCPGYPSDPTAYPCELDSVWLQVEPLPSEVQLLIDEEPAVPLDLCTTQSLSARVSSAQAAYLDDGRLRMRFPPGMVLDGDIEIEYPAGSGNFEVVTPTVNGSVYFIDLEDHSAVLDDGIPGTLDALTPEEREASVRFDIITNCEFISGRRINFQALGNRPCGEAAFKNGVRARTANLKIEGADEPYLTNLTVDVKRDPKLQGCSSKLVEVDMMFIALLDDITSVGDTVKVTLDEGIEYVPGSFMCCSPGMCVSDPGVSTNSNNQTVLDFMIPVLDISMGDLESTCFTYEIRNTFEVECDAIKSMMVDAIASISGVSCPTEPGGVCPSLKLITGQTIIDFTVEKAELKLLSDEFECLASGEIAYDIEIQVDSLGLELGEMLYVDITCADGTYLETVTIEGPIAAGSSSVLTGTVSPGTCDPSLGIIMTIGNPDEDGGGQCICEILEIPSGPLECPNLTISKALASTVQTGDGCYDVTYNVIVTNTGIGPGEYDLYDEPSFDDDIVIQTVSYTSNAAGSQGTTLTGVGPWLLAND